MPLVEASESEMAEISHTFLFTRGNRAFTDSLAYRLERHSASVFTTDTMSFRREASSKPDIDRDIAPVFRRQSFLRVRFYRVLIFLPSQPSVVSIPP